MAPRDEDIKPKEDISASMERPSESFDSPVETDADFMRRLFGEEEQALRSAESETERVEKKGGTPSEVAEAKAAGDKLVAGVSASAEKAKELISNAETKKGPETLTGLELSAAVESFAGEGHGGKNQDAALCEAERGLFGVFDGVGGHAAGDIASRIARDAANEAFRELPENSSPEEVVRVVDRALTEANEKILEEIEKNPALKGMATTAVLVKIWKSPNGKETKAILGEIGDSRVYIQRTDNSLEQISIDDSFVRAAIQNPDELRRMETLLDNIDSQKAIDALPISERAFWNNRNRITQALGQEDAAPRTRIIDLKEGERLLLTSDGIHDSLTGKEIEEKLVQAATADEAASSLTQAVKERGSKGHPRNKKPMDDMTAVVVDVGLRAPKWRETAKRFAREQAEAATGIGRRQAESISDIVGGSKWREVRKDEILPPGSEIRMDMATGKNFVRETGIDPANAAREITGAERVAREGLKMKAEDAYQNSYNERKAQGASDEDARIWAEKAKKNFLKYSPEASAIGKLFPDAGDGQAEKPTEAKETHGVDWKEIRDQKEKLDLARQKFVKAEIAYRAAKNSEDARRELDEALKGYAEERMWYIANNVHRSIAEQRRLMDAKWREKFNAPEDAGIIEKFVKNMRKASAKAKDMASFSHRSEKKEFARTAKKNFQNESFKELRNRLEQIEGMALFGGKRPASIKGYDEFRRAYENKVQEIKQKGNPRELEELRKADLEGLLRVVPAAERDLKKKAPAGSKKLSAKSRKTRILIVGSLLGIGASVWVAPKVIEGSRNLFGSSVSAEQKTQPQPMTQINGDSIASVEAERESWIVREVAQPEARDSAVEEEAGPEKIPVPIRTAFEYHKFYYDNITYAPNGLYPQIENMKVAEFLSIFTEEKLLSGKISDEISPDFKDFLNTYYQGKEEKAFEGLVHFASVIRDFQPDGSRMQMTLRYYLRAWERAGAK